MHYQLFLPEWPRDADVPAESRKRGISDIWENSDTMPNVIGPNKLDGLLVAWLSPKNQQQCYAPEKQLWIESITKLPSGKPAYFIGIWKDKDPTESELRRHYTREGMRADLGGQKWVIPTPTTVDQKAVYNDDGSMRWEPIRQFAWMCDEAKNIRDSLMMVNTNVFTFQYEEDPAQQIEWLLKLLRINYRMLPELATYLELWVGKQHILKTYLQTFDLNIKLGDADGN